MYRLTPCHSFLYAQTHTERACSQCRSFLQLMVCAHSYWTRRFSPVVLSCLFRYVWYSYQCSTFLVLDHHSTSVSTNKDFTTVLLLLKASPLSSTVYSVFILYVPLYQSPLTYCCHCDSHHLSLSSLHLCFEKIFLINFTFREQFFFENTSSIWLLPTIKPKTKLYYSI